MPDRVADLGPIKALEGHATGDSTSASAELMLMLLADARLPTALGRAAHPRERRILYPSLDLL